MERPRPVCPYCGSDEIADQELVYITRDVVSWDHETQAVRTGVHFYPKSRWVPREWDVGDICYDAAEPVRDKEGNDLPYFCRSCASDLREDQLKGADEFRREEDELDGYLEPEGA